MQEVYHDEQGMRVHILCQNSLSCKAQEVRKDARYGCELHHLKEVPKDADRSHSSCSFRLQKVIPCS